MVCTVPRAADGCGRGEVYSPGWKAQLCMWWMGTTPADLFEMLSRGIKVCSGRGRSDGGGIRRRCARGGGKCVALGHRSTADLAQAAGIAVRGYNQR